MKYETNQAFTIPQPAHWVLTTLLKNKMSSEQVGDLFEEYSRKASEDVRIANKWIARQSLIAFFSAVGTTLRSTKLMHFALYMTAISLFTSLTLFISWLSNMDEMPAAHLWTTLLQGRVHSLLAEPLIWPTMIENANGMELGMYIYTPSIAWAVSCLIGLSYLENKQKVSALTLTLWAVIAVTLPYMGSLAYIATHDLVAKQVGPIIAFGVISAFYLILPVTHKVIKATREQQLEAKL